MTWPPKAETTDSKKDSQSRPVAIRMLLTTALIGGVAYGLCRMFVDTDKATGWTILAVLAAVGIQGFIYCTSSSSRDNDGGSSPNQDAFNGLD